MLKSKWKEVLFCLRNLRVTLPYPAQPAPPAEGFRGRLEVSKYTCIGCGACVEACPSRLISLNDAGMVRTLRFVLGHCTYCARCADYCPVDAISMTREFETASDNKHDVDVSLDLRMVECEQCGRPFTTQRFIDHLVEKYSKKTGVEPEALDWIRRCPACARSKEAHHLNNRSMTRKSIAR